VDVCTDDHPIIDFDVVVAVEGRLAHRETRTIGMRAITRELGGLREVPYLEP
jgi:hypothetical protein